MTLFSPNLGAEELFLESLCGGPGFSLCCEIGGWEDVSEGMEDMLQDSALISIELQLLDTISFLKVILILVFLEKSLGTECS